MMPYRVFLLVGLLIFSLTPIDAQTQKKSYHVTGTVYTKNYMGVKTPVPYASVYRVKSGNYLECDGDGRFELTVYSLEDEIIAASAIGYGTDTLTVGPSVSQVEFFLKGANEIRQVVINGGKGGTTLSKMSNIKTEVISSAGLCKMACCNLAESFENSASVTVGFSDAVTGARQIKLLGLSGVYTSILDENRPVMRGLAAPFGLSFIPGQWLESIQIAKGPSSVINSSEAITGQINLEHRKTTDEKPLYATALINSDLMMEANAISSLQLNEKWSTVTLGHVSGMPLDHDVNKDGFRDEPQSMQFDLANRWQYYQPDGTQIKFGVKGVYDERLGGMTSYKRGDRFKSPSELVDGNLWGSWVQNGEFNAYVKAGIPLNAGNTMNLAVIGDYAYNHIGSYFGIKDYVGGQNSAFVNVIYQYVLNHHHRVNAGIRNQFDKYDEKLNDRIIPPLGGTSPVERLMDYSRTENTVGAYGEYTFDYHEMLSVCAGVSMDYNNLHKNHGILISPRANIRYAPADWVVIRASGGLGQRSPNVIADNLGMLSTSRAVEIEQNLPMESAWTYGGNVTFYIPIGVPDKCYFSFDYFRNDFVSQVVADQETDDITKVVVYGIDGKSYTNTYQADFSVDPIERFNILTTFRYTDSKVTLRNMGLVERPLTPSWKLVLNLQYATRMNKWTFDFTAQVNGASRVPWFAAPSGWTPDANGYYYSPVYPMLYAQVTRKFKMVDVYIGGENLTNYKQRVPVVGSENPYGASFNASQVWGPITGIKVYAGVRVTMWKTK